MLLSLSIRDFIIVDHIELVFKPGFTVLTGETGAGKSILIDALVLTLGGRAETGQIRHGCKRAEITAEFDLHALPAAQAWLHANALDATPDSCILRRVIEASGRSRNFINGTPVTLQQLRTISEWLIDIHGQHAHQSLLQSQKQCELLDAWAGKTELARQVAAAHRHWQALHRQRLAWEKHRSQSQQEHEHLTWQVQELSSLNFSAEDWQALQADYNRLAHTASLLEAAQYSLEALSEGETAALSQISSVTSRLQALTGIDHTLEPICAQLESAQVQLQEAAYELKHYQQRLDLDPQNLQAVETRMAAIHGTARKYRISPEAIPELLATAQQRLQILEGVVDGATLIDAEHAAWNEYAQLAGTLSKARHAAASHLSRSVTEIMQTLAMAGGRFEVALTALPEGGQHGLEQIEFQVSAHPGLPLRPLNKAASGGELSRISLAIQVITSQSGITPTLIFDEVDAGIGGQAAEKVGKLLRQLGQSRQVMCVTHLAPVAAMGDQHWQVSKATGTQTAPSPTTHILNLDPPARIEEIARMLGGETITSVTRTHAAEMLQNNRPGEP